MAKKADKAAARRRKRNAERQRALREVRDRKKLCRTCGKKAVKNKRTGKLTRSCKQHLAVDLERKSIVELPWLGGKSTLCRNGGSTANDAELRWMRG